MQVLLLTSYDAHLKKNVESLTGVARNALRSMEEVQCWRTWAANRLSLGVIEARLLRSVFAF